MWAIHLPKSNLAGPQRRVREDEKKHRPSIEREFVALFCTERRDKRRVLGWEVMGWQGVTNFEESAENYFGRMLLPGRAGARRIGGVSPRSRTEGIAGG